MTKSKWCLTFCLNSAKSSWGLATGRFGLAACVVACAAAILFFWLYLGDRSATLAAGLECVEKTDQTGMDRIEKGLTRSGKVDEALVLRCAWLAHLGQHHEVLRRLPPRLVKGPLRREALRLVGESLFQVGERQRAELVLKALVTDFPDAVEAHRLLAVMYYDLGSNELTLKALGHVQRLSPQDYRPYHMAGLILADAEDFLKATDQFRLALDKNPPEQTRYEIQRELAKSLMRVRQYQDAIRVLEASKESADRLALLAECYWSLGEKKRADRVADDALTFDSNHVGSMRIKARLLEDDGKNDDAIKLARKILSSEPYDIETRYMFVQLLGIRGLVEERDREQAEYVRYRQLQDRLVELNIDASAKPDSVELRQELVQVCRDLGRKQLAEMWQRAADFCEERRKKQRENTSSSPDLPR